MGNVIICNDMGVSENSVPLNPMVLLIIIPMKNGYFIGIYPTFSVTNPYVINLQSFVIQKIFCEARKIPNFADRHGTSAFHKEPTEALGVNP